MPSCGTLGADHVAEAPVAFIEPTYEPLPASAPGTSLAAAAPPASWNPAASSFLPICLPLRGLSEPGFCCWPCPPLPEAAAPPLPSSSPGELLK
jgi:hypothetical protein